MFLVRTISLYTVLDKLLILTRRRIQTTSRVGILEIFNFKTMQQEFSSTQVTFLLTFENPMPRHDSNTVGSLTMTSSKVPL